MNAIFAFLKRYFHVLLFIILETACFIMIIRYNHYQSTFYFNSSRKVAGNIEYYNSRIYDYFGLYDKNAELVKENIELRKRLRENFLSEPKAVFSIRDTVYKQRYDYIPAQVITNTISKNDNYITINKGKSSGVEKGQGVFGPEGVIGEVVDASDNFAVIKSVLHSKSVITPKIKELGYSKGSIVWDGKDPNYVYLKDINKYEPMKVGYHITTSPYSKFFPENIPVGVIEKLEMPATEPYYNIKVKLSTNFGNINTVYVVKNLFKEELTKLEEKATGQLQK